MVPPLPSWATEPTVPVTIRPPDAPVLFRIIPLLPPFEEMLLNSRLLALIVVLVTLSAVPVVEVKVFTNPPVNAGLHGFSSQTVIVPPPLVVKDALAPELTATL